MRTRIEVYQREDCKSYDWIVDMAIGSYGRFDTVATGTTEGTYDLAEATATQAAKDFLAIRARKRQPTVRKYINLDEQP